MSRFLKSRDYLMKCLGFVLLFGFISLGAIGGCNNGGGQDGTQALTENDFAEDPGLSANPKKGVVVTFLEHPDSEEPDNDTGEIGNDVIPFKYKSTLEHTFCWEDDDADAEHFMVLEDSDGNEILRLDVGDCVTEVIEAGDYVMIIHHDERIEETLPIFIRPEPNGDLEAKIEETIPEGILERAGRVLSQIFKDFPISLNTKSEAQTPTPTPTVEDNIRTLFSTRSCVGCNLRGASLSRVNLSGVNLSGADLSPAQRGDELNRTNLSFTKLTCTDDDLVVPKCTILRGANLTEANLTNAFMDGADLRGAILTKANLTNAGLGCTVPPPNPNQSGCYVDFPGAPICTDLGGAVLDGAILNGAILIDANLANASMIGVKACEACEVGAPETDSAILFCAHMTGANLRKAVLRIAAMSGATLIGATLNKADLSGANLDGAILRGADLRGAILVGVILHDTDFNGADWCTGKLCGPNSIDICAGSSCSPSDCPASCAVVGEKCNEVFCAADC